MTFYYTNYQGDADGISVSSGDSGDGAIMVGITKPTNGGGSLGQYIELDRDEAIKMANAILEAVDEGFDFDPSRAWYEAGRS